jgi:hypothetical protein
LLEQLKLLEKLQQIDLKLQEAKEALTELPAKLQTLKEDVNRVEVLLQHEREQLAEVQAYKADLDSTNKVEQDQLNKAKSKLSQVRNSKEYMATQREIENTRKNIAERDEELIKLMEVIDSSQERIKVHQQELETLKGHVAEEEKVTLVKLEEKQKVLAEEQALRERMAESIRKDILSKYQTIQKRRGLAVVAAERGVCTGCNMHLPPQLYNILQRGNSIEFCPTCQRIVYFDPDHESGQG